MSARRGAELSRRSARSRFVVVTGLSGAGKSQAIHALEDLGYFCVDNLPIRLIPALAKLAQREEAEISQVAIVVDVREKSFLPEFPRIFRRLRAMRALDPVLIFLEASEAALIQRFSETRRPHPLARHGSPVEGIRAERARLKPIRRMADEIVDTTDLTVHELREIFTALSRGKAPGGRLTVTLLSFGFKHGVPADADLMFDVRFLPNPHYVPGLRRLTGQDRSVVRFLRRHAATREFLTRLLDLLAFLVPQYVAEGKTHLTIGVGCTGGRHRSIMVAEAVRRGLGRMNGIRLRIRHRDIGQ